MKFTNFAKIDLYMTFTVNALLSPRGVYLILDLPEEGGSIERGLIREGGFFTKLCDKDIFGCFSVLLSHILHNQHTVLGLQYINSTVFIPHHTKIDVQGCVAK